MPGCLIPILAAVASAGLGYAGQAQSKSAMNNATRAELERQRAFQDESRKKFTNSLEQSAAPVAEQQMQQGTNERLQGYQQLQQVPMATGVPIQGQSNVRNVVDSGNTGVLNRSRAKLGGQGLWLLDQNVKNLRASQALSQINQNAQNSQALLSGELEHASHRGEGLQTAGQLVGLLGSLYGMSGIGNAGNAASQASQAGLQAGFGPVNASWAAQNAGLIQSTNLANAVRNASALSLVSSLGNSGLGLVNRPTYGVR